MNNKYLLNNFRTYYLMIVTFLLGHNSNATISNQSWLFTAAGAAHSCFTLNNQSVQHLNRHIVANRSNDPSIDIDSPWNQRVYCLGSNTQQQLDQSSLSSGASPISITLPEVHMPRQNRVIGHSIQALSSGSNHTCVIAEVARLHPTRDDIISDEAPNGLVYCWGDNQYGQLGNGTKQQRQTNRLPEWISWPGQEGESPYPAGNIRQVGTGSNHTCALNADGQIFCWGSNRFGQLGQPQRIQEALRPMKVTTDMNLTVAIATGSKHNCAFGYKIPQEVINESKRAHKPTSKGIIDDLSGILLDLSKATPMIECWGWNANGQTGISNEASRLVTTPTRVFSEFNLHTLQNISGLSAGDAHTCFYNQNNVWCWGSNSRGQLGSNRLPDINLSPVRIGGLFQPNGEKIEGLQAGGDSSCAYVARRIPAVQAAALNRSAPNNNWEFSWKCWGSNEFGQLGQGHQQTIIGPVLTIADGAFAGPNALSMGPDHSIYLGDQELTTWGRNTNQQLGGPSQDTLITAPFHGGGFSWRRSHDWGSNHIPHQTANTNPHR